MRILKAFPAQLRQQPEATQPMVRAALTAVIIGLHLTGLLLQHKKKIAEIAEVTIQEVNQILVRYEHRAVDWVAG